MTTFAIVPLALALTVAPAAASQLPLGLWARGDGNAKVRIEPCGGQLCAINTYIRDTSKGENVGDRLIMRVKPKGEGKLVGTAYDPKRRMTYSFDLTFGSSTMTTRGCILGVVCRSVHWSRLQ